MKFTIDTEKKVVTLTEEVELKELISWMEAGIGTSGWKIEPYVSISYTPYIPNTIIWPNDPNYPWTTPTTGDITFSAKGSSDTEENR